jgi:hypothetical protein
VQLAPGCSVATGVAVWRAAPAIRWAAMPFSTLTRSHRLTVVCPVFDLGGHVTFYERTEVLAGRRTVHRLSHLKWGILSSSMPNSFGPGIRRSIVDQPFLYAALPPPLIPFIDLMPPVGGQHLFRCSLQIIGPVGGADCMIFAAKRVSAVSARGKDVFLQARDVRHVISLRPFIAGTACRPVDLEEKARIELQPRLLVPCVPSAIGHKLAVTRYCRPLRQAVLHMVQQYLRDRYLEAIRHCVGWYLHCVEQLPEGRGMLRSGHVALKKHPLFIGQQTNDVR